MDPSFSGFKQEVAFIMYVLLESIYEKIYRRIRAARYSKTLLFERLARDTPDAFFCVVRGSISMMWMDCKRHTNCILAK